MAIQTQTMNKPVMDKQSLIRQAIACFNQNDPQQGKALLQRAADAGSAAAVLYYADILFKEDKPSAYKYLGQQWQRGVKGTLHRRALLRCFFDKQNSYTNDELFSDLHEEAIDGDIQSIVALISVMQSADVSRYYCALLQQFSPELAQQLLHALYTVQEASVTSTELSQAFSTGLQGWQQFNCEKINSDIGLVVAKAALTDIECRYMMLRFSSLLQPSQIVDPVSGTAKQNPYRTGSMVAIVPEYLDWIALGIELKMSAFAGFARQNGEVMNLIHYDVQQRYLPHFDAIVGDTSTLSSQLRNGGQRQLTVLAYLNTVSAGGETSFLKLGIKVPAQAGDMLMFRNIDAAGKLLQASYHAGEPVQAGEKWLLSKWVRQGVTDYGTFVYG
ncbi:2OG-Fe(II) oxygenase [Rheinheimera baltica]|uniref:2OG-Fe(II) oxygenase n=1 Tax=Rheinheimera baltica TaxID=67576 RepID=UPI0012EC244B|nr:2OG-Fe(II) oxygenase [Rheinheimera baltica]